jgi:predicted GIY-YIG superfamily endonuclease
MEASTEVPLSEPMSFADVTWSAVPNEPRVYVIADQNEIVYVGMAGRNGKGGVRNRLRDHASGQIVDMFAQYLFLARARFLGETRITHPKNAKAACREYIATRCTFQYKTTANAAEARALENRLKNELRPIKNRENRRAVA